MREMLFKTLTSAESKKRDLWVQETVEEDGVLAKTERRCIYFLVAKERIDSSSDVEKIAKEKFAHVPYKKRHYNVLKIHNDERGEDKLLCKVAGVFYAVCSNELYCIAFVHSLKITFSLAKSEEENTEEL